MLVVLTGNYCSGKSTELRRRAAELRAAGREPVLIDYDDLAVALGSTRHHGHAPQFETLTRRVRGLAIQLALAEARDHGADLLIVDASPTEGRLKQYRDADAEIVRLDVPLNELHRRAAAERPEQWHRFIDEWTPTSHPYVPEGDTQRKPWRKTPGYRKHAKGWTYERLRRDFLAGKTNCECGCGQPFITDAPCAHPRCLKRGTGCMFHPQYPTVQHTKHLVDGGPSLDTSTWEAWASACNTGDGARIGNARRGRRPAQGDTQASTYTNLDW